MNNLQITTDAAIKAGFKGQALLIAIAIAGAESSFKPDALGDLAIQTAKWGPSVGLWQIRSLKFWNSYSGVDALRDASRLTDPYFNAKAAFAISKGGTDFTPWSTFTSNAFTPYMVTAANAVRSFVETVKNNPITTTTIVALLLVLYIYNS